MNKFDLNKSNIFLSKIELSIGDYVWCNDGSAHDSIVKIDKLDFDNKERFTPDSNEWIGVENNGEKLSINIQYLYPIIIDSRFLQKLGFTHNVNNLIHTMVGHSLKIGITELNANNAFSELFEVTTDDLQWMQDLASMSKLQLQNKYRQIINLNQLLRLMPNNNVTAAQIGRLLIELSSEKQS